MNFLNKIGVIPSETDQAGSHEKEDTNIIRNISRRGFIKGLGLTGSGLIIGIQMSGVSSKAKNTDEFSPDVFISMDKKGTVTIISHRSEMGQGIRSECEQQ